MSSYELPGADVLTRDTEHNLFRALKKAHAGSQIIFRMQESCNRFKTIEYLVEIGLLPKDILTDSDTLDNCTSGVLSTIEWNEGGFQSKATGQSINLFEERMETIALGHGSADTGYSSLNIRNAALPFEVEGTKMIMYKYHSRYFYDQYDLTFLVWNDPKKSDQVGRKLFDDVMRWERRLKGEVWMFDEGWQKNKELYKAIQETNVDDIVLPKDVLKNLLSDARTFFENRTAFTQAHVAWKRGILLLGPPGNGKTNTIRALLRQNIDRPILYVKSFQMGRMRAPERGVRMVFAKARAVAPCILVMEDLDALVNDEIRSFVLNEMDGLESNDGILMIGSTNHPEKLDDSFAKRPSRFDRKYHFDCPDVQYRELYVRHWLTKRVDANFRFTTKQEHVVRTICDRSAGWSYAFLQELFVIFMMRSVRASLEIETGSLDEATIFNIFKEVLNDIGSQQATPPT